MAPSPPSEIEIARLIRQHLGTIPREIRSLRSGAWSSALAFSTSTGSYVLRFAQTADDFESDLNAYRFCGNRIPVPEVHAIGQVHDHWWCLSDLIPGVHLDDLSPEDFEATVPSIADLLIGMREIDSSTSTGYGGWDTNGNGRFSSFAEQILDVAVDKPDERGGGWSTFLADHPYELDVFNRGLLEIEHLCQYLPETRQLIHMDTINYNVNVVGHQISGIYDWGCAMWGDATYDLAWFRFWDPWYPERTHLHIPDRLDQLVGLQGDHTVERMRCYLLHIGIGHIRYNAFLGDAKGMNDVAVETAKLLGAES